MNYISIKPLFKKTDNSEVEKKINKVKEFT